MKVDTFLGMLCEALQRPPNSLSLHDNRNTVPEWDSLGHLAILATMERGLGVSIDREEMRNFNSIQELVDLLQAAGALAANE